MSWGSLGVFFEVSLGSQERDKKRARFRSGLRPSWTRPGASWDVLEASWKPLRTSLARFFASWKPYRIRDLFSNELESSWTSLLNDF